VGDFNPTSQRANTPASTSTSSEIDPRKAPGQEDVSSPRPYDDASFFVAIRYDKTHVLFRLGRNADFVLDPERDKALRKLPDAVANYGTSAVWEPQTTLVDTLQDSFAPAHIGDQWRLEISAHSQIPVVLQKPVALEWNCGPSSYAAGFIAEATPSGAGLLADSPQSYFLIHKYTGFDPTPTQDRHSIGILPDWAPAPEVRTQIEQTITTRVKKELSKDLAGREADEERTDNNPKTSENDRAWKRFEQNTAAGRGNLIYDAQALKLSSDGELVVFVRARWMVDRDRAFLMTMWLRIGTTGVSELVVPETTQTDWMDTTFYREEEMTLAQLGSVLNVFDRAGAGDVLVYVPRYEGYNIELIRFIEERLVATKVFQSDGC
jgi:hypothetical protein